MIHSTSIISSKAQIDSDVKIGPFCIIDDGVKIGSKTELISNVHITGYTEIGEKNTFFPFLPLEQYRKIKNFLGKDQN